MTAREAAALCGVDRRSIYRWLDEGRLTWPIQLDPQNLPAKRSLWAAYPAFVR